MFKSICVKDLKIFVNFLWLNVWTWKLHCAFPFDSDMKWLNHGYSRIFVKAMVVGVVTKPLHKISKANILSKYIWREILTNQILKKNNLCLYQTISEEASLPKKSIQKKSPPKTISKEISFFDTKNGKHRNWWNLMKTGFFIRFHQFCFFAMLFVMFFLFSDFLVEMFLHSFWFLFRYFFRKYVSLDLFDPPPSSH